MKIVTKQWLSKTKNIALSACVMTGLSVSVAYAVDNTTPQLPPPASVNLPLPDAASAMPAAPMAENTGGDNRTIANLESRVTDSVKGAIKGLGNGNGPLTLDDLNTARQAVAKLDALIDIQKRLAEYNKLKDEQDRRGSTLAAAIPASALSLPPPQAPRNTNAAPMEPVRPVVHHVDVVRIVGASGHYEAVLRTPDDSNKTVHVGDRLADGTEVTGISADAVDLETSNGRKHLKIQGVNNIYGHSSY